MPEFTPRLGASRYDHADYFEWWDRATCIAQTYGVYRLRESMIVSLIEHYIKTCQEKGTAPTQEYFLKCVTAFCDRDMRTISRLVSMLEGKETLEFQKPATMNEMPGRQRQREANQTKTVGAFLNDLRLDPNAPMPIQKPAQAKKRLPDGWMNKEMQENWMKMNHPNDLDNVDYFFKYHGVATGHGPLWELKVRV